MRLTSQLAAPEVQVRQRGAVREGIQRPCGSEQSKYRQRCQQGVQVSDGLGGQRFKLAISRRGARARTFNLLAPAQVECDESGAFGEWLKRPWGKQWTKRRQVSINLHWWPRRSSATARFWAAGVWKLTDISVAQVQSRQVDQGTQAGKICTEKDASVGAGVRYSNICIDRLGGQGFKLAISRPRGACTNLLSPSTSPS